jgi:hypothetical protein
MKNITLTLNQVSKVDSTIVYSHTIRVHLNESVKLTFGQLVGQLNYKFFKSTMAMRHSGNKGFSFNNPFHFEIAVDGVTFCDTLTLDQELQAKVRMANTIDGQKRFARLMMGMLYSLISEDLDFGTYADWDNTTYVMSDHNECIRAFADTQVVDLIDSLGE